MDLNPEALDMVTQRYQELFDLQLVTSSEITKARKKMAFLPRGTVPIDNLTGTAPGIFFDHSLSNTWIFCLPGVPLEMEGMYAVIEPQLRSLIQDQNSHYFETELTTSFTDESLLAPFLEEVREKYDVWIKSFPTFGAIKLVISKTGKKGIEEEVRGALLYLQNLIND